MNRLKYWIRDFFGFPRAHVNGFIALLFLVVIFMFSEPVWHWWVSRQKNNYASDQRFLDSLILAWDASKVTDSLNKDSIPTLFPFDPNTASKADFLALGFPESLSTRIVRYREKGGKFRIKNDLLKIYGIDSSFYRRLITFIKLPDHYKPDHYKPEKKQAHNFTPNPIFATRKKTEIFDINTADTAQLKQIFGIGDKLSMRIIRYRDALGGFVTTDQFREVYGLDSVVVERLLKQTTLAPNYQPEKINLNKVSEKQLATHPYFSKVAKAIVSYRFQHGHFQSIDELRNIGNLDDKTIKKIIPYSKVSDDL